jgi:CRISPR-associated protein (TIGR03986 family)
MSDRKVLDLPQHVNPSVERTASAPYNFVPLPEVMVTAVKSADKLPHHDTFANEGYPHSGYFEVTLTTRSPLYVRGMLTEAEFKQAELEKLGEYKPGDFRQAMKNKPDFFYIHDQNQPVIPGSSLRGMLRSLLEIVSYGKVRWVSKKQLFFRTVDDTSVGMHYRRRMTHLEKSAEGDSEKARVKVEGGFLRYRDGRYVIKKCRVLRVHRDKLGGREALYDGQAPLRTPKWESQYKRCRVELDDDGTTITSLTIDRGGPYVLVITGDMYNPDSDKDKKYEFVFQLPGWEAEEIEIDEKLIDRFHDDDQISLWQERAFKKDQAQDKPAPKHEKTKHDLRQRDGMLRKDLSDDGDPVFFLREPDLDETGQPVEKEGQPQYHLTFFGRARMFRLPYLNRPIDLVPPELRCPEDIDFAEALFGYIKPHKKDEPEEGIDAPQGDIRRAYAGRVTITHAVLNGHYEPDKLWLPESPFVPRILASPKPTAFQQYLVQPSHEIHLDRAKKALSHYDSPLAMRGNGNDQPIVSEPTMIRGHKLYWHQGDQTAKGLRAQSPEEDPTAEPGSRKQFERGPDGKWCVKADSKQHTQIKPLQAGVSFTFRVYFENLSEVELGALCWTLNPQGEAPEYCHSLGMGKPLGLGAVKLESQLYLSERAVRYEDLFAVAGWKTGIDSSADGKPAPTDMPPYIGKFEQQILMCLGLTSCARLREVKRIALLLKMMEWPGRPADRRLVPENRSGNTRYMSIQLPDTVAKVKRNEYKERPVLPDPAAFDTGLNNAVEPTGVLPWPPFTAADRQRLIDEVIKARPAIKTDPAEKQKPALSEPKPEQPVLNPSTTATQADAEATLEFMQRKAAEREAEEERKKQLKEERRQRGRRR